MSKVEQLYMTQDNEYSCGIVAIMNALAGVGISCNRRSAALASLFKLSKSEGIEYVNFNHGIKYINNKFDVIIEEINATTERIITELKNGGHVIILIHMTDDTGENLYHYQNLVGIHGDNIYTTNDMCDWNERTHDKSTTQYQHKQITTRTLRWYLKSFIRPEDEKYDNVQSNYYPKAWSVKPINN